MNFAFESHIVRDDWNRSLIFETLCPVLKEKTLLKIKREEAEK
jgi:hypothetical protein